MYFDKRTETLPAPVQRPELTATQQHCLEAAEYIRSHGWIQGSWHSVAGFCLMGAMRRVTPNIGNAENHLRTVTGTNPVRWNDKPGRTKQEVLDLLEQAAATQAAATPEVEQC